MPRLWPDCAAVSLGAPVLTMPGSSVYSVVNAIARDLVIVSQPLEFVTSIDLGRSDAEEWLNRICHVPL